MCRHSLKAAFNSIAGGSSQLNKRPIHDRKQAGRQTKHYVNKADTFTYLLFSVSTKEEGSHSYIFAKLAHTCMLW